MTLEQIVPFIVIVVLALTMAYSNARSSAHWRRTIEIIITDNNKAIRSAMMMAKSQDAESAVKAETLEKSHELQLKVMQDTLAETEAIEEEKNSEDKFKVHTADGREIDLRQWEVVG